jgi:hypothetical protein
MADHPPTIDGRSLVIDIEIMTPEGAAPTDIGDFRPSLAVLKPDGAMDGYGGFDKSAARPDGARWLIASSVPLTTSTAQKRIWVSWAEDEALYFPLALGRHPSEADFTWSDWRGPEHLYRRGAWIEGDALPDFRLRTRVQFEPDPIPPPTDAEVAAERDATEAAALTALSDDAPLASWLPFTRSDVSPARRSDVLSRIASRPELAADIRDAAVGDAAELAAEVLRLAGELPAPPGVWRDAVQAAGQHLVHRMERSIRTPEADDPSYEWAAPLSIRFSGWLHAARLLREAEGYDPSADLGAMLQLARQRPDSYVMQQDIVRVASYYLQEWSGPPRVAP